MNTQKTVNERIAKVALKNQKVDLAIVDDLKDGVKYINGIFGNIEKEGDKLGTALADAIRQYRNLGDFVQRAASYKKEAERLIQAYKKAAQDLGVNADSQDVKNLQKAINEIDSYVKFYNSIDKIPQV